MQSWRAIEMFYSILFGYLNIDFKTQYVIYKKILWAVGLSKAFVEEDQPQVCLAGCICVAYRCLMTFKQHVKSLLGALV